MIQDSGDRTAYETGAVRDMKEGKGRCDLMPLMEVATCLEDEVIYSIAKYQEEKDRWHINRAISEFIKLHPAWDIPTAMLELSIHFEEGAEKYGERNWEMGIPEQSYIDSAVRHHLKFLRGDDDERHDRAVIWNLFCLWWTVNHEIELEIEP